MTLISTRKKVLIEVISDTVCPWCWVGKRRLEQALRQVGDEVQPTVLWRPFELNPDTPAAGLDRHKHLTEKYGVVRIQQMQQHLAQAAAEDGLAMHFDRIKTIPNTLNSHRLNWWAARQGRQDAVVEGLFAAYFRDGLDIGQQSVLTDVASAAGLNADQARAFLQSAEGTSEVRAEEETAYRMRVTGVPAFFVNGHYLASGAQPPDLLAAGIREAVTLPSQGTVCGLDGICI